MSEQSADSWAANGGDLRSAADRLAEAKRPGALLRVEIEPSSLKSARDEGLPREREGLVLQQAWARTIALLPSDVVGRRTSWSRFELVVEGARDILEPLALRLLDALERGDESSIFRWHLVLTEIFLAETERTFLCDPGYDLRSVEGKSAIAWVEPHSGSDWREPARYPTVSLAAIRGR